MNIERIIRYAEQMIDREKYNRETGHKFRIEAYTNVIDFISNADKASNDEIEKICKVWDKHWSSYMRIITGREKPMKYSFNNKEINDIIALDLIPNIKKIIADNFNEFGAISVDQFFDTFLENLPEWWRKHQFTIRGITKNFNTIYQQIIYQLHSAKNSHTHSNNHNSLNGKATMASMMSNLSNNSDGEQ